MTYGSKGVTGPIPRGTKAFENVQEGQVLVHMLVKEEEERWNVFTDKIYDIWINPTYSDVNPEKTLIRSFIDRAKGEGCREVWQTI